MGEAKRRQEAAEKLKSMTPAFSFEVQCGMEESEDGAYLRVIGTHSDGTKFDTGWVVARKVSDG